MRDFGFENRLINNMLHRRHDEIEWMLNHELKNTQCHFGTLLWNAAMLDNAAVARHLIQLGTEVDCPGQAGRTPLMVAVMRRSAEVLEILLEANASICKVDNYGDNVLQVILHSIDDVIPPFTSVFGFMERLKILVAFFQGMKSRKPNVEEFIEKLLRAGYSLFHVVFSNDINLLERTLERGVDIDSTGYRRMTALHAAVRINDFSIAKWLLQKGANVNALDEDGRTPLLIAAMSCNKLMVQLLLERGADPNVEDYKTRSTPLYAIFYSTLPAIYRDTIDDSREQMDDCVELLLQYGAVPRNSTRLFFTMFDCALSRHKRSNAIYYVIAHLATLDDSSIASGVMRWRIIWPRDECAKFDKYFEHCQKIVDIIMFENMSLRDLLTVSEYKLRLLARNKTFAREVQKFCTKQRLKTLCLYYFKTLTKRISNAADIVKLEDEATAVICKMFQSNYNLCYDFGRKVVAYLNKHELEQLCLVCE